MPDSAIIAAGLRKSFGDVEALTGVDLEVPSASVFALLGPNGAGKTTAVRIFSTLLRADAGTATVGGFDVAGQARAVRERIGLSGQDAAVNEALTGEENLEMVGRLYRMHRRQARKRALELLERFELTDAARRPVKTYSGGMRRRLDLAAALVARPPVVFLDEPTTGLDPRSRLGMWDTIERLVGRGATVLLTTQYLEEADRLADNVAVIDAGRVIAEGSPAELKARVGGERVEVATTTREAAPEAAQALAPIADGEVQADAERAAVTVPVRGGSRSLMDAVRLLDAAGVDVTDIALRRPTLDDVFLSLTGHAAEEPEQSEAQPA
ncbi:MAG TPA: ATP-binding cassette domain-containing protein [Solirubrobacteraceae bacterium]|nr:ATP-binding cassette domain-containing protein [Solirubrobacteraceae bacterium]